MTFLISSWKTEKWIWTRTTKCSRGWCGRQIRREPSKIDAMACRPIKPKTKRRKKLKFQKYTISHSRQNHSLVLSADLLVRCDPIYGVAGEPGSESSVHRESPITMNWVGESESFDSRIPEIGEFGGDFDRHDTAKTGGKERQCNTIITHWRTLKGWGESSWWLFSVVVLSPKQRLRF